MSGTSRAISSIGDETAPSRPSLRLLAVVLIVAFVSLLHYVTNPA